jgi:hypothetical protein
MQRFLALGLDLFEDEIIDGLAGSRDDLLLQVADVDALQLPVFAAVQFLVAGDDVHQRRFAGAVLADKTDFVAFMDMKGHVLEDRFLAESDAAFENAENEGRGHFI